MIYGIYQTATSLDSLNRMQDVVANNLANMTTNGFKQELLQVMKNEPGRLSVASQVDMSAGPIKMTDNPTDLAITSDGFFAVQSEDGVAYTRSGDFKLDSTGRLVTNEGLPVLGKHGEILIGTNKFTVNGQGEIFVGQDQVDQLELFKPQGPMVRIGQRLLKSEVPDQMVAMDNNNVKIMQGAVEASNVNPVEAMVNMMLIVRQYEANQKAMSVQDESIRPVITQVGKHT